MSPSLTRLPSCSCRRPTMPSKGAMTLANSASGFALSRVGTILNIRSPFFTAWPSLTLISLRYPFSRAQTLMCRCEWIWQTYGWVMATSIALGLVSTILRVLPVASFRGSLAVGLAVALGLNENERAGCVDAYRCVAGHLDDRHLARRLAVARDQNVVGPAR